MEVLNVNTNPETPESKWSARHPGRLSFRGHRAEVCGSWWCGSEHKDPDDPKRITAQIRLQVQEIFNFGGEISSYFGCFFVLYTNNTHACDQYCSSIVSPLIYFDPLWFWAVRWSCSNIRSVGGKNMKIQVMFLLAGSKIPLWHKKLNFKGQ